MVIIFGFIPKNKVLMYFMMYMIISNKTPIFRYCVLLVARVTLQQI